MGKLFYPLRYTGTATNPATGRILEPYSRGGPLRNDLDNKELINPWIEKGKTNGFEHADKREGGIYQEKIVRGYEPHHRPWMVYLEIYNPEGLSLIFILQTVSEFKLIKHFFLNNFKG